MREEDKKICVNSYGTVVALFFAVNSMILLLFSEMFYGDNELLGEIAGSAADTIPRLPNTHMCLGFCCPEEICA